MIAGRSSTERLHGAVIAASFLAFSQAPSAIWPISGLRFLAPSRFECKHLMTPKVQRISNRTIKQTARIRSRLTTANAYQLARLDRVAHRNPTAVLGVLEFWLGPETIESETRVDC